MDRDLTSRQDRMTPPDDAELGSLVRAAAEDWHRPPQRLDQATWRERVDGSRRGSTASGGRRWFGRLAEAGVLAVVATVVLAVGAVYLTGPGRNGTSGNLGSNPSSSPTEGASPSGLGGTPSVAPGATSLPSLLVNGDLPSVTSVLLQGSGGYRMADLATGTVQPDLPWPVDGWNTVLPRPGGGWVCVCTTYTSGQGGPGSDELVVNLDAVGADGSTTGSADVRTVRSTTDPSQPSGTESQTVDVRAFASADGRFAFIGWSERSSTGWRAGIDVVDLVSLRVVDRQDVPDSDVPAGAEGKVWTRLAPLVDTLSDVGTALVTVNWWVEDPLSSLPPQGTLRWTATFADGALGEPVSAGARAEVGCYEWEHGLIDASGFYVACIRDATGAVVVERYALDGSLTDEAEAGRFTGFGAFAARPDHRLFLWDPQSHTLVSFDLLTGATTSVKVPETARISGPLDVAAAIGQAVGHWIAPTVAAKIYLQPAIAVSPDGTRLYALGIDGAVESLGSAGVFAFDITGDTPVSVGRWDPTADFISLAVTEDGAFVYATGIAGITAGGIQAPGIAASVTVFDASDGSVRLIAGQLPGHELLFVEPVVR